MTITEENEEELEQLRLDDEAEKQTKKLHHLLKINDGSMPTVILHDNDDRADILENENEPQETTINNIENSETIQDENEHLSTIYESLNPHPQTNNEGEEEQDEDVYDDAYDKLIVYDIANIEVGLQVNNCRLHYFVYR